MVSFRGSWENLTVSKMLHIPAYIANKKVHTGAILLWGWSLFGENYIAAELFFVC
jgi:hypothetical protein